MKSSLILTALCALPWLVSAETLLFVDDHEILYRPATKRTRRQPVRHESNPLIIGPSIKHQIAYCSVYRNTATGSYQMWCQMTGAGCVVCYAESKDGITRRKPELDILTFKGIPDRNVVPDDKIRFYFGGAENPWNFGKDEKAWGSKKKMPKTGIGLATLPRGRFAGLKPLERIGQITLKPRSLAGVKSITVNASAVKAAMRVGLLDAQGYRIPGFTKTNAVPITGDHLRHSVTWKEADLSKVPAGEAMIRLHLDRAEVFAISLQPNQP